MTDQFQELLSRCTFKVDGPKPGTAFAVSSKLLVTCRHVVENVPAKGTVTLRAAGRPDRKAKVFLKVPSDSDLEPAGAEPTAAESWPDVALLEVTEGPDLDVAVLLDANQPREGAKVHVGGFAHGDYIPYSTQKFTVGPSVNEDEQGHLYTQISQSTVDGGYSGSAVLTKSGTVCGVVNANRLPQSLAGGYFIPISDIILKCESLSEFHATPAPAAEEWIAQIDTSILSDLGRQESGALKGSIDDRPATIDISFGEVGRDANGRTTWTISATHGPDTASAAGEEETSDEIPTSVTTLHSLGLDFPDELFVALDNLVRRRELDTEKQVQIRGKALQRIILNQDIRDAIKKLDPHRPKLVRLLANPKDSRTDIPWEYAIELATSEAYAFSRFVPTTKPRLTPGKSIQVLMIVYDFDGVRAKDLVRTLTVDPKSKEEGVLKKENLKRTFFQVLESPSDSTLGQALKLGWDVVHIVATATSSGTITLPNRMLPWSAATQLLVGSQARAVVLQLASPRFDAVSSLSGYLDLLTAESTIDAEAGQGRVVADVRALVLAQHITTHQHVTKFTNPFYSQLDQGCSIEQAVQTARRAMRSPSPPSPLDDQQTDDAAFATVSVVTTAEGNVRLLEPSTEYSAGEQRGSASDIKTGRNIARKGSAVQSSLPKPSGSSQGS